MDRRSAGFPGGLEDAGLREIAFAGRRGADGDRLVRFPHEGQAGIGLGIDGDGADAEHLGRADDAAGDFAPVGNEKTFHHTAPHILNRPKRGPFGIGAFRQAEKARPSTSRVWRGSMMPSSHRRAVA